MKERAYLIPPSHGEEIQEWQVAADQVASFINERCLRQRAVTKDSIPAAKLYKTYQEWAKENGHRPMSSSKFGQRVVDLGVVKKKTSKHNVYTLRWVEDEPLSPMDWDPLVVTEET